MNAGPPQRPEDHLPRRPGTRTAAWSVGAGVILGVASLTCLAVGAVSGQQAMAIGLPGALLIVGGLIVVAAQDEAIARRLGFRAGFRAGSLLNLLRSIFRSSRNGL